MTRQHMMALVAAAVVAVVAAFWTTSLREPTGGSVTDQVLLPGLSDRLNDVSTVALVGPGNEPVVTLTRGDSDWTVDQSGGYPADTGRLREMLVAMAEARIAEAKTASADNYHHLGVEDVADTEAGGVKVTLSGPGEPVSVIVGKRPTRSGTYVRIDGEAQSYLIDKTIELDGEVSGWLDTRLMDVPSGRIQAVTVIHDDGERLELTKTARGEANFLVNDIPEGRSLSSPGAANALGTALQGLDFTAVTPEADFEAGDGEPVVTEFVTFDGVRVTARSVEQDGKNYAWFNADFDPATASRFAPGAATAADAKQPADPSDSPAADKSDGPDTESDTMGSAVTDAASADGDGGTQTAAAAVAPPDFTGAQEEAAALEAALSGWVFEIPSYKRRQMIRRMDELLAAEQ